MPMRKTFSAIADPGKASSDSAIAAPMVPSLGRVADAEAAVGDEAAVDIDAKAQAKQFTGKAPE
ncbi:hypothetical protein K7G19_02265 [Cupriavidus sp. DB3]|nr:hypothetical protein [Cupriavidus sp. DB3]MCA7082423.1 hypothetical protein [Cupriavidus sp. DB3]